MGRVLSFSLLGFGALTILFELLWILSGAVSTQINASPVPPPPGANCYGAPVPFPYPWSCPPNYQGLPSPFDTLPLVSIIYFSVGAATIWSALAQRFRHKILLLSLSAGLVATFLGLGFGQVGEYGWPIIWSVHPNYLGLGTYSPVYIVVPAFLADWALFSPIVGVVLVWVLPYVSKTLKRK